MAISRLFPTLLYSEPLRAGSAFQRQLLLEVKDLVSLDVAGHEWSSQHYPNGFTTYASANELHRFSPTFRKLEGTIDRHVSRFAKALDFDLGKAKLRMTNCWVNVMHANAHHNLHLHPLSVISGTYYVSVPKGARGLKLEDPRLPMLMHSPPRKRNARQENRQHLEISAQPGSLLLFESWLRHEVPMHLAKQPRISVSFNYDWQ